MPSLTPQHRSEDVVWVAMKDGLMSGLCGLVPSSIGVWAAMKNPKFVKATNWQSRTALVITPPLFMFAWSAEHKLQHRMQEMASEAEHSKGITEWAERHHDQQRKDMNSMIQKSSSSLSSAGSGAADGSGAAIRFPFTEVEKEKHLAELYRQGVENSGVRIVPGDRLGVHHQLANFWQENPFKILGALGVPTVLYIFHGRQGQQHLQLQMKLMHTRVFGQFAVISLLLTLMGFKEYMDRNGKFITEAEAQGRVMEMQRVREEILARVERDRKLKEEREASLRKAHDEDVREGHDARASDGEDAKKSKQKKKKKQHVKEVEELAA